MGTKEDVGYESQQGSASPGHWELLETGLGA